MGLDENFGIKIIIIFLDTIFYLILKFIIFIKRRKKKGHHFLRIAELYINDLYVNKKFDNEIFWYRKNLELTKIDKIKEKLEKIFGKKKVNFIQMYWTRTSHNSKRFLYSKMIRRILYFFWQIILGNNKI